MDKEDLRAIAELIDKKLQPMENRLSKIQSSVMLNAANTALIRDNTETIQTKLENAQEDIGEMKENIEQIKFEVGALYEWQESQDKKIRALKEAQ